MGNSLPHIGFIGTGVMGKSMAGHLLKAGYPLTIYSRTKSKADELIKSGAQWADTPSQAATKADFVISIVGLPTDVKSIYLEQHSVLETLQSGKILIDMTTSSPSLAIEINQRAKGKGILALDAPVSGGDIGAREATLSIMVGGDREAFDKAEPILAKMGKNIAYHGSAGSGQHTKLSNQIVIAGNMIGMVEGLYYAKSVGLDLERMLNTIQKGAAASWSLNSLGPRILKNDFEPGFRIIHFVKDMGLVLSECEKMKIKLPGLELVHQLYSKLLTQDYGQKGTQALIHALENK
jgi:3-hydroxyisobutyrate dehydrogenase